MTHFRKRKQRMHCYLRPPTCCIRQTKAKDGFLRSVPVSCLLNFLPLPSWKEQHHCRTHARVFAWDSLRVPHGSMQFLLNYTLKGHDLQIRRSETQESAAERGRLGAGP